MYKTNRQKLITTNIYDSLLKAQKQLNDLQDRREAFCIIDVLNDNMEYPCICDCEKCIAKWLND